MNRPAQFEINTGHQLAQGLVFAHMGRHAGTDHLHDSSAYGNHGIFNLMSASTDWGWEPELGRFSLAFDGTGDVDIASPSMTIADDFGFAAWIKVPTANLTDGILSNDLPSTGYAVLNYVGALAVFIGGTGSTNRCVASSDIPVGEWVHVAANYNKAAESADFYYDGEFVNSDGHTLGTYAAGGSDHVLGRYSIYSLAGTLADVLVRRGSFSTAEITRLSDPSNVMLDGMILPPRRRMYASVAVAGPSGAGINVILGGGIIS